MRPLPPRSVTFIRVSPVAGLASMDIEAVLALTPEQVAGGILARRQLLNQQLPFIIQTLEESRDQLTPQLDKAVASNRDAQHRLKEFRDARNKAQSEAKAFRLQAEAARTTLAEAGKMISLDPKWKQDKLLEQLEKIERKIETTAGDHLIERGLLKQRRTIILANEAWLKERRKSNPEMASYVEARAAMTKLYKAGDKEHERVLQAQEKAEPINKKFLDLRTERRDTERQLHQAKAMMKHSQEAVTYWQRRINDGFGELEPGYEDLLADAARVREGGASTSSIRRRERLKQQEEEE